MKKLSFIGELIINIFVWGIVGIVTFFVLSFLISMFISSLSLWK